MFDLIHDTIVAIASAPGYGERGIVRISGDESIRVLDSLFSCEDGSITGERFGYRRVPGLIEVESGCRIPVEVWIFRAPRSYTRQDSVEIHGPGSPVVLSMIAEAFLVAGVREAQPGEFTARAFLNGGMDLTSAEAVAGTIHARSDEQLRAARELSEGKLSQQIRQWQKELIELLGLIEADIDFAEQPIEFITPEQLQQRLELLILGIQGLCRESDSIERLQVLPRVMLIGPPNAGKSTLLNALSGMDRAICSAVSGTTRDVLSVLVSHQGFEYMLLDAAGVEDSEDALIADACDHAVSAASSVDLLVVVQDSGTLDDEWGASWLPGTPRIRVANKVDLLEDTTRSGIRADCQTSGTTGEGVKQLRHSISSALQAGPVGAHDGLYMSTRHHRCLKDAATGMEQAVLIARTSSEISDTSDLLAFELHGALESLRSVTGEVTTDDLLESVFASFCIGK